MMSKRQKLARILFIIGLVLLLLALAGTGWLAYSSRRSILRKNILDEDLIPPTVTPIALLTPTSP